jgi:hypothetical protein
MSKVYNVVSSILGVNCGVVVNFYAINFITVDLGFSKTTYYC